MSVARRERRGEKKAPWFTDRLSLIYLFSTTNCSIVYVTRAKFYTLTKCGQPSSKIPGVIYVEHVNQIKS